MQVQVLDSQGTILSSDDLPANYTPADLLDSCLNKSAEGFAIVGQYLTDEIPGKRVFNIIASQGVVIANNVA